MDRTGNLYADDGGSELREGAPVWNNEQHQSRVDIILTLAWRTHNDVDMIYIKLRGKRIRQQLFRSQFRSNSWGILGRKIVDGKGDLPDVDILHINVAQRRWVFLPDQIFEDADIFVLQNFNSEGPVGVVTEKKAVER